MAHRCRHLVLLAIAAATATGCASATARFYTLDSTATASGAPPGRYAVLVGPVSVPPSVDRPQMVVQVAPNRVELEEFNRWAGPLNDSIARAIAGDLAILLGTSDVAVAPLANFTPAYRVTIDMQAFESVQGQSVFEDAVWTVRQTANGQTQSGRTTSREPVQGTGFDALAAAHSRALARISGDIAAAITAAADRPTPAAEPVTPATKHKRK